jgi:signal transduction histidine kinase/ActR/RegA family two-component response regulator
MNKRHVQNRRVSETLRSRLAEAEEMLRAIRRGEIDALVVEGADGNQIYTLHSAEEPYRTLVEQMQEGAVVLSSAGGILYANACFAALVGEPLESVVGSRIVRFVKPSDRNEFENLLEAGRGRCRCSLIGSGSGAFDVNLSLTRTASPNGDRLNLIVTDLSALMEANNHRERAERQNRTKDEFLAMLAHELRSPLATITTAMAVLEATLSAGGESAAHAHDVIMRQVDHVSLLINDLLDVERVVSGKIRLDRQPLDLADAVRNAVGAATGDAASDRCVEIRTEPVWVEGDPLRLEQVVTNVVNNALKYTPAGGRIAVTLRAEGGDALLRVEDTGVGISPTLLPSIFDLYVQADRTVARARGGLGIGLTLVRRLVELHGGTVEAFSDGEGRGSTFTIRLKQVPSVSRSAAIAVPRERRATPRRVLLIEDSADARQMLRLMLELAGHVVYDAADGVRGLALLNVVRPDVAVIDIGLPAMDGYQVARRIREDAQGRGMLLLALSGYDAACDSNCSREAGFDYHLVKPVDPEYLERLITEGVQAA